MRRELPLRHRALVGAIGTLVTAGAITLAVQAAFGAFDGGYELVGTFDRAGQGLSEDADVKLRGVTVGRVESIELDDRGRAEIRIRIDDGIEVPDTAAAAIAPISVFGPTYVQLVPGEHERSGPFLADGDELAQTRAPIEFNEVLADAERLLGAIDPTELAIVVSELADGVRERGPDLSSALTDGGELLEIAERHDADTARFLHDLGLLGDELGSRGDELVAAMDDLGVALDPLVEEPDRLGVVLGDTQRLATELSAFLGEHADAVGAGIVAGAAATEVLVAHLAEVPGYLQSLARYFDVLGRSIHVPGPGGSVLATQKFFLSGDLCRLISGLCPPGRELGLPIPTLPPPGTPPMTVPVPPVIIDVPPLTVPSGPR